MSSEAPWEAVLYSAMCAGAVKLSHLRVRSYKMLVITDHRKSLLPVGKSYAGTLAFPVFRRTCRSFGFSSLVQLPPPRPGTLTYPLRRGYDEFYVCNLHSFRLLSSWLTLVQSDSAIGDQEARARVQCV